MSRPNELAILRASSGRQQAKRFARIDGEILSTKVAPEPFWRVTAQTASTIDELATLLKRLADDPTVGVIREAPKLELDISKPVARRAVNFDDVPRSWVMVDIDDLAAPHLDVAEESGLAAHYVRDELALWAPELEGVAMFLAWSGSCGIRDHTTLKAHVWFCVERTSTSAELKRWARAVNERAGRKLIDEAIYSRVQLHFNARPICDGLSDPLPGGQRFVLLSGAPAAALVIPEDAAKGARSSSSTHDADDFQSLRGFEARLAAIGVAGINAEAFAAFGAAVAQLGADGAEAAREMILGRIADRIRATRDPKRAAEHVDRLDGMFDRVVAKHREAHPERADDGEQRPGVSLEEGRARLREVMRDTLEAAIAHWSYEGFWRLSDGSKAGSEPPQTAVRVTVGAGKSVQARAELREFCDRTKKRVLYLVGTHRLGADALADVPDELTAMLWQGRGNVDKPTLKIDTNERMCRNLEAVDVAIKVGAQVQRSVCRSGPLRCRFYDGCLYQAQRERAAEVDVIIAAHEIGFQLPEAFGENFGLVLIDEGFWQDGTTHHRLAVAGLAHELTASPVRGEDGSPDADATAQLRDVIERLQVAFAKMPDGYVTRAPLIEAGFVASDDFREGTFALARRLELARDVDPGLRPGASLTELQRAAKRCGFNSQLPHHTAMEGELDELLSGVDEATGRLRLSAVTSAEGTTRFIEVAKRKPLRLANVPVAHLDATLEPDLVRAYLPRADVIDIAFDAPHQHVTQVVGLRTGKRALLPDDPTEMLEAQRRRRCLVDFVKHRARGSRLLVVAYKGLRDDYADIPGVEFANFGAIEGLDCWRDVECLVVIGRPDPTAASVERDAAAISGKPVKCGQRFARQRVIRPKSGAQHRVTEYIYEHPVAEAVRRGVTDAAIVQAVGRGRGVIRTAANPIEVFVIVHDKALPLPVGEVVHIRDLLPGAVDAMILRGLIPQMPTDAHKLGLFPTREAAKKAYQRARRSEEAGARLGTSPYRDISLGTCPHARVRYQPQGKGQLPRLALVDPVKVPDVRAVLEAALGPLVLFEVLVEAESQAKPETAPVAVSEARVEPPPREPFQTDMFLEVYGNDVVVEPGLAKPELVATVTAMAKSRCQTQGDVAQIVQLSQSHYCNWRKGRYSISAAAAERLAAWLRSTGAGGRFSGDFVMRH